MSYILDALRRAEHERKTDETPGLHEHTIGPIQPAAGGQGRAPWLWMAAGAGIVLLAGLAWALLLREPAAPPPVAPTALPAPAVVAPVAVAVAVTVPESAPAPITPPATTPAAPPPAAAVVPQESRVIAYEQLPPEVRRALPPMNFDGTVYSDDPASRMLMINGQLLREGEAFTAEITVERIKPASAVLRYRGTRFEISKK